MTMTRAFDCIENKEDTYRGEDCMKKFCESLREHAVKIINFEKTKICYIWKQEFKYKYTNDKNYL